MNILIATNVSSFSPAVSNPRAACSPVKGLCGPFYVFAVV